MDLIKDFKNEMYEKTKKYQQIYGFEVGSGKNDTWNNEADAFKHAFMQAVGQYRYGSLITVFGGQLHEKCGELCGQPQEERNMDLWNNKIGREVERKIKNLLVKIITILIMKLRI